MHEKQTAFETLKTVESSHTSIPTFFQGCQMVYFLTRNPNFGGPWNEKGWYIRRPYFWPFGNLVVLYLSIFPPVWVHCVKKNLATLPISPFIVQIHYVSHVPSLPTIMTYLQKLVITRYTHTLEIMVRAIQLITFILWK
jgi:hypothetical protein